jgi:hypothetical protein
MPPKSLKRKKEDAVEDLIASLNVESLRYAAEVVLDGKTRGLRDLRHLTRPFLCQMFLDKLQSNPEAAIQLKKETARWLAFQNLVRDKSPHSSRLASLEEHFDGNIPFREHLLSSGAPIRLRNTASGRYERFRVSSVTTLRNKGVHLIAIDGVYLDGKKRGQHPPKPLLYAPPSRMFQNPSEIAALYLAPHCESLAWKAFQVLCQREYDSSSSSSSSSVAVVNPLNKFVNHYLYDANVISIIRDFLVPAVNKLV